MADKSIHDERSKRVRRIMRRPALRDALGLGDTAIDALIKSGELPKPMQLTDSQRPAVGWFEDDIVAYQEKLAGRNRKKLKG